jgi:hypothetical protein
MQGANSPPRESGVPAVNLAGVRLLLRGGDNVVQPETESRSSPASGPIPQPAPEPERPLASRLLGPSLVCADVLLVLLAVWMVFTRHGRLGVLDALVCGAAVLLGGWLACLALWRRH